MIAVAQDYYFFELLSPIPLFPEIFWAFYRRTTLPLLFCALFSRAKRLFRVLFGWHSRALFCWDRLCAVLFHKRLVRVLWRRDLFRALFWWDIFRKLIHKDFSSSFFCRRLFRAYFAEIFRCWGFSQSKIRWLLSARCVTKCFPCVFWQVIFPWAIFKLFSTTLFCRISPLGILAGFVPGAFCFCFPG